MKLHSDDDKSDNHLFEESRYLARVLPEPGDPRRVINKYTEFLYPTASGRYSAFYIEGQQYQKLVRRLHLHEGSALNLINPLLVWRLSIEPLWL